MKDFRFELIQNRELLKIAKKTFKPSKVNRFINKYDLAPQAADIAEHYGVSVDAIFAYSIKHLHDGRDYRVAEVAGRFGDKGGYTVAYNPEADFNRFKIQEAGEIYGFWNGVSDRLEILNAARANSVAHEERNEERKRAIKSGEKAAPREAFIPTVSKTKAIPVFSNSYKRTLDLSVPYTVSFRIIDAPIVGESLEDRGVRLHTKYMDDYAAKSNNELTSLLRSLSDNLVAERELTTIDFGRIQTADAAGYDSEGNPVVVEFKTGKEHYEKTKSAKAQLLRYAKGMSRVANFDTISMVLVYPEDGMKVETFTMTLAEVLEQYSTVCIEQGLKDIVDNNSQLVADLLATKSLGGLRKSDLLELLADIKAVKRAIDIAKVGLKKFK